MKPNQQLIYISLVLIFISCSKPYQEATFDGEIINPAGKVVSLSFGDEEFSDSLDINNRFSFKLKLNKPENITLKYNDEVTYIYLRPNDQVSISLDPNAFDESIIYKGTSADINNYLAAMVLLDDSLMSKKELYSLEEKAFLQAVDSISNMKLSTTESFKINDKAFLSYLKENRKWEDITDKVRYENYRKRFLKLDSFKVSDDYYSFMDTININDPKQLKYKRFESVVNNLISSETDKVIDQLKEKSSESYNYTQVRYEVITKLITDPKIKEIFLFQIIRFAYTDLSAELKVQIVEEWQALNPPVGNIEKYEIIKTGWEATQPGNQAPGFKYVSVTGDSLTLESFAGKLLYIDVWATWCGPCIREQPSMAKLQEKFKNQDVVFLAISIDNSPIPWKKMITDKSLGGMHAYAPGEFNASIMRDYAINGIPRFILIDKEGKIINADAPRPSGNIEEIINKYLAKDDA